MWHSSGDVELGPCHGDDLATMRSMRPDVLQFVHDDGRTSEEYDLEQEAEAYLKIVARRTLIDEALEFGPADIAPALRRMRDKNDAEITRRGGR